MARSSRLARASDLLTRRRISLLDLGIGAAALGLIFMVASADPDLACPELEPGSEALTQREASLSAYFEARCEGRCDSFEVVASRACRAKVRLRERRVSEYGEPLGTFVVEEGLAYSALLERWQLRETLASKQVLGLPSY